MDENKTAGEVLESISKSVGISIFNEDFSNHLDSIDNLSFLRNDFHVPLLKSFEKADLSLCNPEDECIYMCGNSLGLQPKKTSEIVSKAMDGWNNDVLFTNEDSANAVVCKEEDVIPEMAKLVGAQENEVIIMNALTVNIHLLLISFYQPTPKRHKILIEGKAFPSDHYVAESQIRYHGYDPKTSLLIMDPRQGEDTLRSEDIVELIEKEGETIALVMFSGIQFYTGQLFDMELITKIGHSKGCRVGFDLAHAVGNVELALHDWDVDFACWCTYKYLCSGPGGIGGAFLHEKHEDNDFKKFVGPWLNKNMDDLKSLKLPTGINCYKVSRPSSILLASLKSSLDVFGKTSMKKLTAKSFLLTGYLEYLIKSYFTDKPNDGPNKKTTIRIITPESHKERGAQLSLLFSVPVIEIHKKMSKRGIVCDVRKPNIIRIAPAPIYCRFHDVFRFVESIRQSCDQSTLS